MNNLIRALVICCLICGCKSKPENSYVSGPYFYMSAPPEDGFEPPGDLTETEAREIAARGYAYYVAYFDSKGKPDKIIKVSNHETEVLKE